MEKSTGRWNGNKKIRSPLAKNLAAVGHTRRPAAPRRAFALLLVMVAFLAIAATGASAQVLYGTLTGTVTDTSGAAIVGAQITAAEVQTGVTQTANADSAGIYRFAALLPGTYKVTITANGFSKQETPGVLVRANEVARVDASGLKVGGAAQEIVVTTEAPLLQTDKADVHTELIGLE